VPRPSGRTRAWRLRLPAARVGFVDAVRGAFSQDLHDEVGDVVLRRADGLWAYQLAVVVDDAAQGITDIVRGADLLDSTPRQIHLQQRLGAPTPRYAHLPLLLDPAGAKLGKSLGAAAIDPRDPLPALRRAWSVLGQDVARLGAHPSMERVLAQALAAFEPALVPSCDVVIDDNVS
jgi:glutamyl-Q tRNA(Asp) synthetase